MTADGSPVALVYADVLGNLALIDAARGRPADALRTLDMVLRISSDQLSSSAAVQSEREQLAWLEQLRGHLDAFLGLALKTEHDPEA